MADEVDGLKFEQRHGKDRVRVARVWKGEDGRHFIVEWSVSITLLSDCIPAYLRGDNSDIVATDTMKNTVYVKAKECPEQLSVEDFAIRLAKHFASFYQQKGEKTLQVYSRRKKTATALEGSPQENISVVVNTGGGDDLQIYLDGSSFRKVVTPPAGMKCRTRFILQEVTTAIIKIVEKPWERICIDGHPHEHGFKLGSEKHTTEVIVKKSGSLRVTSGVEGLALLKTTKSGFEGFIRDKNTILPETRERMLATEVTASWRYPFESLSSIPSKPLYFTEIYLDVKKVLVDTFFGPPKEGVYSPSVQCTLYQMAKTVLGRFPDISSIQLKMPNIHFLPVNLSSKDNPVIVKFEDDVYLPTDEPHGTIEASLSRIWSKM